jgi:hypothetical protein
VSNTGATLTDTTNNIGVSLGDFASGCLLPNARGACLAVSDAFVTSNREKRKLTGGSTCRMMFPVGGS